MPDNDPTKSFTIRLSESELARLESLRERLQSRADSGVRITQRITVLRALEQLEAQLDKLDRDKGRQR